MLLLALIAVSVIGIVAAFTIEPSSAAVGESCVGLNCWPSTPPIKHRPVRSPQPFQPGW
jgi:hypothetical protein